MTQRREPQLTGKVGPGSKSGTKTAVAVKQRTLHRKEDSMGDAGLTDHLAPFTLSA